MRPVRLYRGPDGKDDLLFISYPIRRPRLFGRLTTSEIDVVEGVLRGQSHAEIAKAAGVSVRTVANQLAAAYDKLGVSGATELALLCSAHDAKESKLG